MMFKNTGQIFLIKSFDLSLEEKSFYKDLNFKHFIFFKEHFKRDFRAYLENLKQNLNLGFLAVDQEGGRVCRIDGDFKSPLEIASLYQEKKDENIVRSWAKKIAETVKNYNLNLNLAPCVDLADEKVEDFLRNRTFGKDPDLVKRLAKIFIEEHKKQSIFTCIKHFPGLKDIEIDPHKELPFKERLDKESLKVFKFFIKKNMSFIMTTHILIKEIENIPVTFSEKMISFLRKKLNYKGLIFTDDLNMGALNKWELQERIILSIASGHNILIFCGYWENLAQAIFDIKSELEKSQILKERLKESLFVLKRYF
ncbi:glycoside hydrolase family 3 N-terminal domain-containing protein [Thermodesulfobacterium hydrogeniphilum]|uniref:glycoside hydrolase family 3 N-terminal domain-containing protein n=1 Tax=Thermodesulfobacterium hydrogeniphilum TaxID=161156 RepID=UPI0005714644|nr:glycoside hydrolase family 3 N-terminal domain-containing protein [Thermodesulfobacterium hydrogeniphilum]